MQLSDFEFQLPTKYIAQRPVTPRDHSRLMFLDSSRKTIEHHHFYDLVSLLRNDDVLVVNNSKVIPARLYGTKEDTGANVEILLLKRLDEQRWEVLAKPGKRLRMGGKIRFKHTRKKGEGFLKATVETRDDKIFVLRFNRRGKKLSDAIHQHGVMPTPPYITETLQKPERYQTVYAAKEGSVAAPTAGLHFTPKLIRTLISKGITFETVDLHVGMGTFMPVQTESLGDHIMHSEYYELSKDVARRLNTYKKQNRRIIAVGTTSVRVLESCVNKRGLLKGGVGETNIFIYPKYDFCFTDGLITNFHLPKSTLIMLVSAFAGKDFVMKAYETAKKENYRFYSFGDAMLIV